MGGRGGGGGVIAISNLYLPKWHICFSISYIYDGKTTQNVPRSMHIQDERGGGGGGD